jgi:pimeloyl-ACP methyl ester carboxylesterase
MDTPSFPFWNPWMAATGDIWLQWAQYCVDATQRWVLTMETYRQRANQMLDHADQGMPPLLAFPYEIVLDGRTLERPVNYALLHIVPPEGWSPIEGKPPMVIIDPRAGHGPGIGGFKEDSEVGIAIEEGHHTYFIAFYPHPCQGQTLEDVEQTEVRFLEEVYRRHPDLPKPIVYGNCQAGWATAMLGADRPDVTGPMVINGAPMSYWAGAAGVNPMRLGGGLSGGAWGALLLCDLGGGELDGAWLVHNFENLNPAKAIFRKSYDIFDQIDTQRDTFMRFEKWWTGFYFLGADEFELIVSDLFIGNDLEQGELELGPGHRIDLRNIRDPLVVFASSGDNITPPHQALHWIWEVYRSTEELKRNDQRIVYLINPHVGHLGIFVSARVARREHRAIIESLDKIGKMPPGLYEMKILGETGLTDPAEDQFLVAFEERDVEDVRYPYAAEEFEATDKLSQTTSDAYKTMVRPWIRATINPATAAWLRWFHPQRLSRLAYSERFVPAMAMLEPMARMAGETRRPVAEGNVFRQAERDWADLIQRSIESWTETRDQMNEALFKLL